MAIEFEANAQNGKLGKWKNRWKTRLRRQISLTMLTKGDSRKRIFHSIEFVYVYDFVYEQFYQVNLHMTHKHIWRWHNILFLSILLDIFNIFGFLNVLQDLFGPGFELEFFNKFLFKISTYILKHIESNTAIGILFYLLAIYWG